MKRSHLSPGKKNKSSCCQCELSMPASAGDDDDAADDDVEVAVKAAAAFIASGSILKNV